MRELTHGLDAQPCTHDCGIALSGIAQDWKAGAAWFWDTLVDADPAENTLGWHGAAVAERTRLLTSGI